MNGMLGEEDDILDYRENTLIPLKVPNLELIVFWKEENSNISPFLELREIRCHCEYVDCTRTLINTSTLRSFNLTRKYFGKPIKVNSGYRCQRHNEDIGGKEKSYHKIGSALDLTPLDYSKKELKRLKSFAEQYFDVVLEYDTFIHCHMT